MADICEQARLGSGIVLTRQKVVLALLEHVGRAISSTAFVKMMFLLRQETSLALDHTFYDFLPYRFGPFSFSLYRELSILEGQGYVVRKNDSISRGPTARGLHTRLGDLPGEVSTAIQHVIAEYGRMNRRALIKSVYSRYSWYTTRSQDQTHQQSGVHRTKVAPNVIYTVGYEGKSVDGFFNGLLRAGILALLDVRANPVSRKYGFTGKSLRGIASKLGMDYHPLPELGIPSHERVNLHSHDAYESLFHRYERQMLPSRINDLYILVRLLREKPSALLCVEKDVTCCHRSRLARAAAILTALPIVHL